MSVKALESQGGCRKGGCRVIGRAGHGGSPGAGRRANSPGVHRSLAHGPLPSCHDCRVPTLAPLSLTRSGAPLFVYIGYPPPLLGF